MQIKGLGNLKYRAHKFLPHKFNLNGSDSVYVFGINSPGFADIDENHGIS